MAVETSPLDGPELVMVIEHESWCVLQAMADQGSGGAFEISQRMTAMIGWGATTGFAEKWVFDQAADTYALDQEMADKLRR